MPDLVLATSNPHKVDEIRAIFQRSGLLDPAGPAGLRLLSLADLRTPAPLEEPAETGRTFEDNATIKALSYARQTGHLCLADDSGLEIDALAGRPGVISSHYSTDGHETGLSRAQRDEANNARVLRELETTPPERRTARFVCVMVLAGSLAGSEVRVLAITSGAFEGRIGLPAPAPNPIPRGHNGFGYDPLFLVAPDFTRTSAELDPAEKNHASHRGAAARAMAEWLTSHAHEL